jgi:hypothetical protein
VGEEMRVKTSSLILKVPLLYFILLKIRFYFSKSKNLDLIFNISDLNSDYYKKIKKDRELEHQIGRLTNYKKIIGQLDLLEGDIIEFGVWKGFSLLWIAYFMERNAIFNKKIIGLDSFRGLPASEGVFKKYDFADTSLSYTKRNIQNCNLYRETKGNIFINKFLFKETNDIYGYISSLDVKKFCFINIDCDVSKSLNNIFDLLIKKKLLANKCYILIDDYNCTTQYKNNVDKIMNTLSKEWNIKVHSSTNLTRNYLLTKK